MRQSNFLLFFEGKEKVTHIITEKGEGWKTASVFFRKDAEEVGGYKLNTVETETKHVLFVFDSEDREIKRYYLGKRLQGKTPEWIVENMDKIVAYYSYNPKTKEWIPCVEYDSSRQEKWGYNMVVILDYNKWRVEDAQGNIIVPPGKYDYIDCFDRCGLARVKKDRKVDFINPDKSTKDMWGIINSKGEEVLEVKYSQIWKFYNKQRRTAKVFEDYTIEDYDGSIEHNTREYEFNLYTLKLIDIEAQRYQDEIESRYSIMDALDGCEEAACNIDAEDWI